MYKKGEIKMTRRLTCDEETYKLIMQDCVKEFRRNHPEFEGKPIHQNHILRQIAKYYAHSL